MKPNDMTREIIGAAIDVHRGLGPGQDEVLYEDALEVALTERGMPFRRQAPLPVFYKGVKLDCGFRPDFVVADAVTAECKSVETLHPVFAAQVRTYQRLGGWPLGLLLNFNVPVMKEGISRFIVDPAEFRNVRDPSVEKEPSGGSDDAVARVIGAAIEVHRHLGPGLLQSVYVACLRHELFLLGLESVAGRRVDVVFQGKKLGHRAELELVVANQVIATVLAVQRVLPVHVAQVKSQMRLAGLPDALLLNFHAKRLTDDLRRFRSSASSASSRTPR